MFCRGMFVYTWDGKENPHDVVEVERDFDYIKTTPYQSSRARKRVGMTGLFEKLP